MSEITNLISNIGFPIAMCILMFNQYTKLSNIINENTKAINSLADRLDDFERREK